MTILDFDKVKGCIFGSAVGDALGATTEMMSPEKTHAPIFQSSFVRIAFAILVISYIQNYVAEA